MKCKYWINDLVFLASVSTIFHISKINYTFAFIILSPKYDKLGTKNKIDMQIVAF